MEHSFPEVRDHVQRGEIWDSHHPHVERNPRYYEEVRNSFVSLHDEKIPHVELLGLLGVDGGRRLGWDEAYRDDGVSWMVEIREVRVTARKSIYDDGIYGLTRSDVEAGEKFPVMPESLYAEEKHPHAFDYRWERADYWMPTPWHGYTVNPMYEGSADIEDSNFYPARVVGSDIIDD